MNYTTYFYNCITNAAALPATFTPYQFNYNIKFILKHFVMLPSTFIGFKPLSPALIKDFEDTKYQQFVITKKDFAPVVPAPLDTCKKEQLIAAMAFRFFGLHNMPIYKADTAFLKNNTTLEEPVQATQLLGELKQNSDIANNGLIYSNNISKYKSDLPTNYSDKNVISFSIAAQWKEIIVTYNTSKSDACEKFILLSHLSVKDSNFFKAMYGYDANSYIQVFDGLFNDIKMCYIRLYLKPLQLIILKNF